MSAPSAPDPDPAEPPTRLLAGGWVHLRASVPVEVRREMSISGNDGVEAGRVAAVVLDRGAQAITHVILCRFHPELEYRLVALALIEQVTGTAVRLRISSQDVDKLPRRSTT